MSDLDLPADLVSPPADTCVRCGYDLRGVANDQPCTECGLLAERSRRVSDRFRDGRPGYLLKLSIGVWLILASLVLPVVFQVSGTIWITAFPGVLPTWARSTVGFHVVMVACEGVTLLLFFAVWLLTSPEQHEARSRFRGPFFTRLAASVPLLVVLLAHVNATLEINYALTNAWAFGPRGVAPPPDPWWTSWIPVSRVAAFVLASVGLLPLPILLSLRLRALGRRLLSRQMTEHSLIVGVGVSVTIAYIWVVVLVNNYPEALGLSEHWTSRSPVSLVMVMFTFVGVILFWLWALYLLIRFAIAFGQEARALRRSWESADRGAT